MNQTWEKALDKIKFYQIHPEYKPFIGERYDAYKILQVGESHFIEQDKAAPKDDFPIQYFDQWWTDSCKELKDAWGGCYDTRVVINRFLNTRSNGGYSIFANMLRIFERVYLHREDVSMTTEVKQDYQHFAFMNFFQMPSLYQGEKFWNALGRAAQKQGKPQLAFEMWDKAVEVSADTLDAVIDVIKPEVVIITSKSAYDAYRSVRGDNPKIIEATHPCSPWWYRKSGKDMLSGQERLERRLLALQAAKK